jgi:3-hydroxybutyryl-CoA dehydratase
VSGVVVTDLDELMKVEATLSKTVGESDVYLFAGITGDLAPYHVDEHFMQSRSYGGRVVHGVLTLGFVSAVSTKFWESVGQVARGISAGYDGVRFVRPVYFGDTLHLSYRLEGYDPQKRQFRSAATATNQHGQVCLVATHLVRQVDMDKPRQPETED